MSREVKDLKLIQYVPTGKPSHCRGAKPRDSRRIGDWSVHRLAFVLPFGVATVVGPTGRHDVTQAKGVLPRDDDREVLYRNARTCGYFIFVRLQPDLTRDAARGWFGELTAHVDELVERDPSTGERVAAVAVGLASSFFTRGGLPRFDPPIEPPAAFRPDPASPMPNTVAPLSHAAVADADLLLYVVATKESRVSRFIERLWATRPIVQAITTERGHQRDDGREPFGYLDGLRNVVPASRRSETVFVHRDDTHFEEPAWADAGTYMAFIKIVQNRDAFGALDPATRDQVIGRTRDGARLDLVGARTAPRQEPSDLGSGLPESAHVRKAGPRGARDDCQIFRRGLPFVETSPDGQVRVGLQFCSFQASLDQFDVVFNDWMTNARFPTDAAGVDALLDPSRGLTSFEKTGFYFVPPHHEDMLAGSLFEAHDARPPRTGRLVIRKHVIDSTDPTRRFDRRGFGFTIHDPSNQVAAQATTDSTGRAVVDQPLQIGVTYTVTEDVIPLPNINPMPPVQLLIEKSHQELRVLNQVTQPNTPYGG